MVRVYEVRPTSEDYRPVIVFHDSRNAENDWLLAEEVLEGVRDELEYPEIAIHVEHRDAVTWHGYVDGGMGGLYSEAFVRFLGSDVLSDFQLLPANLNGARYYFLKRMNWLECFDLVNSKYKYFRSNREKIRSISEAVFVEEGVPRDRLFAVPQMREVLLASEEMVERILKGGYRGVECRELGGGVVGA